MKRVTANQTALKARKNQQIGQEPMKGKSKRAVRFKTVSQLRRENWKGLVERQRLSSKRPESILQIYTVPIR